jgi:hypothetical protein
MPRVRSTDQYGIYVTWQTQNHVTCTTEEDVYDLLGQLTDQELATARVWRHDTQRRGIDELELLERVFGD